MTDKIARHLSIIGASAMAQLYADAAASIDNFEAALRRERDATDEAVKRFEKARDQFSGERNVR